MKSITLTYQKTFDQSMAETLTRLAYYVEYGCGFMQDYETAIQIYEIAAELGHPYAYNNLGKMYEDGLGTDKDIEKAIQMYEKAAELGDSTAMVNLGNIYKFGTLDGEPDYDKAIHWYKMAAEEDDEDGLFNYANCLHHGWGTIQDRGKAFSIFKQLMDDGYNAAAFYVGLYYHEGLACEQDYDLAREYYRLGALEDDELCYNQLGVLYANGQGVKKDVHAAMDYYRKAAELGDSLAYANVAWLYESGEFGEPDVEKTKIWYQYGAFHGDETCKEQLARLGVETNNDYNAVLDLIDQWKVKKEDYRESFNNGWPAKLVSTGFVYAGESICIKPETLGLEDDSWDNGLMEHFQADLAADLKKIGAIEIYNIGFLD